MRKTETEYYEQIIIKGNYFPYYEKNFGKWIDKDGNYDIEKLLFTITCDQSKKEVAIDIGANVGLYTRILAKVYDLVIAFEPSSQNRACIYRNMDKESNKVIVLPYALGEKKEKSKLRINLTNCGGTAIDREYCNSEITEDIEIIRGENITKALAENKEISHMKIDIQGRELQALKGIQEIIQMHRPLIICEVDSEIQNNEKDIDRLILNHKYKKLIIWGKDIIYIPEEKYTKEVERVGKLFLERLKNREKSN